MFSLANKVCKLTRLQLSICAALMGRYANAADPATYVTLVAHADMCTVTILMATEHIKTYQAPCLYLERAKVIGIKCRRYVLLPGPWDASRERLARIVADLSSGGFRYQVRQTTFLGARIVFASDDPQKVARYLVAVRAYRATRISHDGGYTLYLPSGETMRQGADGIDVWICENR